MNIEVLRWRGIALIELGARRRAPKRCREVRQSHIRISPFIVTDRSGEPLEGGLSRAVETLYGKEGAQGKVSAVLRMAGSIRAWRHDS